MIKPDIFIQEDLPPIDVQQYGIDTAGNRLLLGYAVAKSVVGVMTPVMLHYNKANLPQGWQDLIKNLNKFGEPLLYRDYRNRTLGLNFTAAVLTVHGLSAKRIALYDPGGEQPDTYACVTNDLNVVRAGTRTLYERITGSALTALVEHNLDLDVDTLSQVRVAQLTFEGNNESGLWQRIVRGVRGNYP